MSDHVLDRLADYLEGRLTPEETAQMERHLADCEGCMTEASFARTFREEALRQGVGHLAPDRLVEIAEGTVEGPTEAEGVHLEQCEDCTRYLRWAEGLNDEDLEEADVEPARIPVPSSAAIPRRLPRILWGTAGAIAAMLAFLLLFPEGDRPDVASLARPEPLPVTILRDVPTPGSIEETRRRAMEKYRDGDYPAARASWETVVAAEPEDGTAWLYLGSAALLSGDPGGALPYLRTSLDLVDEGLRELVEWHLANAALAAGRRDEAMVHLRRVVERDARFSFEASELIEEIESR